MYMARQGYTWLLLCCSLLLSCSDYELDNLDAAGNAVGQGKAYLTVTLTMPQIGDVRSSTNSQGGTDEGTENATDEECKITDAYILLGEIADGMDAPIKVHSHHYITDFKQTGNNPALWRATVQCDPGRYRVMVIANPGKIVSKIAIIGTKDWNALVRHTLKADNYKNLQTMWQGGNFLMTNAYCGSLNDHDVVLESGRHTDVEICVQRACARFDYQAKNENNVYFLEVPIDGAVKKVEVQLKEAALMNVSNNFNLFKQIVKDNAVGTVPTFYAYETGDNYVYDSDWEVKRYFMTPIFEDWHTGEYFFYPSERKKGGTFTDTLAYKDLSTNLSEYGKLFYCSENTVPGPKAQINKLSTGIVFKGTFSVPGIKVGDIYYYKPTKARSELYTSLEQLREALKKEGVTLPDAPNDNVLASYSVKRFIRQADGSYPVWFTYWNRHNDNGNDLEMGIMEFTVVRNNIYKLQVNSISALGLPKPPTDPDNPWKPAGDTPDELIPVLDITVEVSKWVERTLDHEI